MRILLLAFGLLLTVSAASDATPTNPEIRQAQEMMRAGHATEAVQVLEHLADSNRGGVLTHHWLARAYGEAARSAGMLRMMPLARKAGAAFARAVEFDPDFLDARFGLMEFNLMAPGVLGGSVDTAREQAVEIRRRDSLAGRLGQEQLIVGALRAARVLPSSDEGLDSCGRSRLKISGVRRGVPCRLYCFSAL